MEAIILSKEQYDEIIKRIEVIQSEIQKKQKDNYDPFVDNQEFLQIMNISKRTAQTWRDQGIISFSQIGSKIYYKMSDVNKLLKKNYRPSFNN